MDGPDLAPAAVDGAAVRVLDNPWPRRRPTHPRLELSSWAATSRCAGWASGRCGLTGEGIWGPPADREVAKAVLRRAVELGVNFIDTADSYGPEVSEELIAEALHPYPRGLVIATKGGLTRPGPGRWERDWPPRAPARGLRGKPAATAPGADRPLPAPRRRPPGTAGGVGGSARRAARGGEDRPRRAFERGRRGARARPRDRARGLGPEPLQRRRPRLRSGPRPVRARGPRLHSLGSAEGGRAAAATA